MEKIVFKGYDVFLKQLRTDKGFRIEVDTGLDEYDNIKDIPKLPSGVYKIIIEPEIEETK